MHCNFHWHSSIYYLSDDKDSYFQQTEHKICHINNAFNYWSAILVKQTPPWAILRPCNNTTGWFYYCTSRFLAHHGAMITELKSILLPLPSINYCIMYIIYTILILPAFLRITKEQSTPLILPLSGLANKTAVLENWQLRES